MNLRNLISPKFLIAAACAVGTFSGAYYGRLALNPSPPLLKADEIISNPNSTLLDLEESSSLAKSILFDDPKNCKALIILALSYQRRNLVTEAINQYKILSSVSEEFAAVSNFNLAVLNQGLNNTSEAEKYYLASIKFNASVPLFEANLIKLYLNSNQHDKARERLIEALKTMPSAKELLELKPALGL